MESTQSRPRAEIFVMSGGGSRGAAQVGMAQALMDQGIIPTAFVGASVGALNACFLAVDPSRKRADALARRWRLITKRHLVGPRFAVASNLAKRRPYLYSSERLRTLVSEWTGVNRVEDLAVPVRIATTALASGRGCFHDAGDLQDLLAASTALPAVFPPVMLGEPGERVPHVDAGIFENLPVSAAADLARSGDRVWLLDVTKPAKMRDLRTPLDVLVAALAASVCNRPAAAFAEDITVAEVKLDVTYDCGPVFDFSSTDTLIEMGRLCAEQAVSTVSPSRLPAA